jgi:nucleoside-diphosphate-sugar epimerase
MVEETVLVTGGCGFIGTRLIAALKTAGHSVRVLDIHRADFDRVEALGTKAFKGSVTDGESVREALGNSRVVYHMVAPEIAIEDDGFIRRMVVAGAQIVMEEAEDSKVEHVVTASTTGVYFQADGVHDEGAMLKPRNRLERAKLDMERSLRKDANRYEIGVTCLRLGNVYGAGDRGIVDRLAPEVAMGGVTMPGEGWINTVHVDDVVDAARRLAALARSGEAEEADDLFRVFNCTDGTPNAPDQLIDIITKAEGASSPDVRRPGLMGGGKGFWASRSRSIRFVEKGRYSNEALKRALPDWPAFPTLAEGLPGELEKVRG